MIESFKQYLVEQGYSEKTPAGSNSTVYDYSRRVLAVCERENITLNELAADINSYVQKYDILGSASEYGQRSNAAVINALKQFEKFRKGRNLE